MSTDLKPTEQQVVTAFHPVCEYRTPTDEPKIFYCRHSRVHAPRHLVSLGVCRVCFQHEKPCADPRPLEYTSPDEATASFPGLAAQVWNLTKSIAEFVADGMKTVSEEQYALRLQICEECPERKNNRCLKCGCHLSVKAKGRAFQCPLGKWEEIDNS